MGCHSKCQILINCSQNACSLPYSHFPPLLLLVRRVRTGLQAEQKDSDFSDVVSQNCVWQVRTQLWVESEVVKSAHDSENLDSHIHTFPSDFGPMNLPEYQVFSPYIWVMYYVHHWFVVIIAWKIHARALYVTDRKILQLSLWFNGFWTYL